jgi:hypothetical protein
MQVYTGGYCSVRFTLTSMQCTLLMKSGYAFAEAANITLTG